MLLNTAQVGQSVQIRFLTSQYIPCRNYRNAVTHCKNAKVDTLFQASDSISELEQSLDQYKRSLKDAEEQRQRQMRVRQPFYEAVTFLLQFDGSDV